MKLINVLSRFFLVIFITTFLFVFSGHVVQAATLYIDGDLGSNCTGNYSVVDRSCSGEDGNAYNTISAGIGAASAGDIINIRSGTYNVSSSSNVNFSSDSVTTTIQAYNSEDVIITNSNVASTTFNLGSNAKNIIFKDLHFIGTPYYVITGWTNYSTDVWTATLPYSTTQVRFNTTNGSNAGSIAAVNAANEYYISGTTIYVYSVGDPSTTYTSPGINLADNFSGGAIGNPSHTAAGNLITVDNCQFEDFSHAAIKGTYKWHVKNSRFYDTGTDGLDHHIYANGVQTLGNEMIFEHNYFGYTPGSALNLYTAPAYVIVRYNVFNGLSGSNRSFYGIIAAGTNLKIYNNTFYGFGSGGGITLYKNTSQNNTIKNNIFSNNTTDLNIDSGGASYPTNNIVETNYFGSSTKCIGCTDFTGSGGPNLSTLDDDPPNSYSSSPWTQFTYSFNKATTGATFLQFFNLCGGGATPTTGTWYLDDISIIPTGGGSEQLLNGNFESTFTSGIASGWSVAGGTTGSQETSIVHGGSNSQKLSVAGGCGSRFERSVTLSAGNYTITGYAKRDTGTGTLVLYIAGLNTSATIGRIGPLFLGTEPYSSAFDFKVDPSDADSSTLINGGVDLGAGYQWGFNSVATSWPISNLINQSFFGVGWDLGAFVYNTDTTAPVTTDNTDSIYHRGSVTVTLSCSDSSGAGCSTTYYTTDGTTPTTSSNSGNSIVLNTEGSYTIKYFSVDHANNQESVKTATNIVRVDATDATKPMLISPIGNTNDSTRPTLIFGKAIDTTSGISSYTIKLDSGKNRSFTFSGIPSSGNGSANYVWRDDNNVKIVFVNENDSDVSNDQIHVYFKDLGVVELSEGKHTWEVTASDGIGNTVTQSADFYHDRTSPFLSELAIADVSAIFGGITYNLPNTNRIPSFSGLASDLYRGSTVTNINGTKDTFDSVSSEPKTLTLILDKYKSGQGSNNGSLEYDNYLSQEFEVKDIVDTPGEIKSSRFYITTPFPLKDGLYKVKLVLDDKAGNSYDHPVFYISISDNGEGGLFTSPIDNVKQLFSGSLKLDITDQDMTPTIDEEENQQVQEDGYQVKIKVVNSESKPIKGAKVTIHSKVQETITDENGIAHFSNVEKGDHRVLISYDGYKGEKNFTLTGDVAEFSFEITVVPQNPLLTPQFIGVASLLSVIIVFMLANIYRIRRKMKFEKLSYKK